MWAPINIYVCSMCPVTIMLHTAQHYDFICWCAIEAKITPMLRFIVLCCAWYYDDICCVNKVNEYYIVCIVWYTNGLVDEVRWKLIGSIIWCEQFQSVRRVMCTIIANLGVLFCMLWNVVLWIQYSYTKVVIIMWFNNDAQ